MLNKARFNQVLFNGGVAYVAKLVALTGSLVVSGFASADVQIDKPFAASVTPNVTVSAPLEKLSPLAAAVHAAVTSQPELAQSTNLGAVINTSVTLAPIDPIILNVVRSSVDVTATVADVEIEQTTPMSAVAPAVAEAGGVFDLLIPIEGQASVEATSNPELELIVNLDGQSSLGGLQASGTLSGAVDIEIPLAAQVVNVASAAGLFELEIPLGADALAQGAVAGDVHLDIPLDGYSDIGGIQAVGTLEADLGLIVNLEVAPTDLIALSSGYIKLDIPVAVDALASAATTGGIHLDIPIGGTADTAASADADVHITVNLDGQSSLGGIQAEASLVADVDLTKPLGVAVLGPVTATADIHLTKKPSASVDTNAVTAGNVHLTIPVATNAEAAAEIDNSKLRVIHYYDDLVVAIDFDGVQAAYAVYGGIEAAYEVEDSSSANWEIDTVEAAGISYLLQAA